MVLFLQNIQQLKLRLPPFKQHCVPFPLVVAEGDILPIDVPVACRQLSDQRAFGYLAATQKPVWTDIVGKRGKEQTVFSELPEHRTEFPQVFPKQRLRIPFGHRACRELFSRQKLVPIAHIRVVFFRVPALKVFCAAQRPLEKRQAEDCRLPLWYARHEHYLTGGSPE